MQSRGQGETRDLSQSIHGVWESTFRCFQARSTARAAVDAPRVCRTQLQPGFQTLRSSLLHSFCMMLDTMCGCATFEGRRGACSTQHSIQATRYSGSSHGTIWQRMTCPQCAKPALLLFLSELMCLGRPGEDPSLQCHAHSVPVNQSKGSSTPSVASPVCHSHRLQIWHLKEVFMSLTM